jgi:hypothetical protein
MQSTMPLEVSCSIAEMARPFLEHDGYSCWYATERAGSPIGADPFNSSIVAKTVSPINWPGGC